MMWTRVVVIAPTLSTPLKLKRSLEEVERQSARSWFFFFFPFFKLHVDAHAVTCVVFCAELCDFWISSVWACGGISASLLFPFIKKCMWASETLISASREFQRWVKFARVGWNSEEYERSQVQDVELYFIDFFQWVGARFSYLIGEYCDLVGAGLQQVKGSQMN